MELFREAVDSGIDELRNLQQTLEVRPTDASNFSAVNSHLARINVWAVSIGLADHPKSEFASHWANVSLSIQAQTKSLLNDLVGLCREGTSTWQMQIVAETREDSTQQLIATTVASGRHFHHVGQVNGIIDQALFDYFGAKEPKTTTETPSSDELAGVLSDIEDVIDCLSSLAPSIRNATRPKLRSNTSSTITESNGQLEWDTRLVQTFFSTLDSILKDRLLMAISWRRKLIANWKGPPSQIHGREKSE